MLDEQGWQPPKNLPENLHLVMLTSDNSLLDTWSNGVRVLKVFLIYGGNLYSSNTVYGADNLGLRLWIA